MHDRLRELVRTAEGCDPQPSAAVLDSQTAHSHEGGDAIGWDAGKRTRGRKRHLLVDTGGLLLKVVVHAASVQERARASQHSLRPGYARATGDDWFLADSILVPFGAVRSLSFPYAVYKSDA